MPNAYLVAEGLEPRTIAETRPVIDPETGLETLPFVAPMTDEAKLATKSDADKTRWLTAERAFDLQAGRLAPEAKGVVILPKPAKAVQSKGQPAHLRSEEHTSELQYLMRNSYAVFGFKNKIKTY